MYGLIWAALAVANTIFFLMVMYTGEISDGEQAIISILAAVFSVTKLEKEWEG